MKKILTFLLPLAALGGGIAGGEILRPSTESGNTEIPSSTEGKQQPADDARADQAGGEKDAKADASASSGYGDSGGNDEKTEGRGWFTFPSQFFVPLMRNGDMGAMMIVTLTIETDAAQLEKVQKQESRLRDALLRQLMIQANTGGFDGNFTTEPSQRVLREELLKAARAATDLQIDAVLIEDIARQTS